LNEFSPDAGYRRLLENYSQLNVSPA